MGRWKEVAAWGESGGEGRGKRGGEEGERKKWEGGRGEGGAGKGEWRADGKSNQDKFSDEIKLVKECRLVKLVHTLQPLWNTVLLGAYAL